MNSAFVIFFLSNTTSSIVFDDLLEELVMLLKLCSLERVILFLKKCLVLAVHCLVHYPGCAIYVFCLSYGYPMPVHPYLIKQTYFSVEGKPNILQTLYLHPLLNLYNFQF